MPAGSSTLSCSCSAGTPCPHPDDRDAALKALSGVDLVRGLLDRAEFVAVKIARRQGKALAEIGTQLGMSRQAAWDKLREFDVAEARQE